MGERAHTPGAATCPIAATPNMFEALLQGARLLEPHAGMARPQRDDDAGYGPAPLVQEQ